MPTTIKDIATACGTSKATVRRKLEELGFYDNGHVSKQGKTFLVSDHAASAVSAALSKPEAPKPTKTEPPTIRDMYERYIAVLETDKAKLEADKEALQVQLADKDREISKLNDALVELSTKMADLQNQQKRSFWSRLLGSGKDAS